MGRTHDYRADCNTKGYFRVIAYLLVPSLGRFAIVKRYGNWWFMYRSQIGTRFNQLVTSFEDGWKFYDQVVTGRVTIYPVNAPLDRRLFGE